MEGAVLPNTGVIAISAPTPGRIEQLAVTEGDGVRKNALLYTVDVDTARKGGGVQQQIIENLKAHLSEISGQITMQQNLVIKVGKDYGTFAALVQQHVVPIDELNPRQQAWREAGTRLQDLERSQLASARGAGGQNVRTIFRVRLPKGNPSGSPERGI